MYVGIDVGGSKILLGTLTNQGVIKQSLKVPTPPNYREFLESVKTTLASFDHQDFKAAGVAIPATRLNRNEGIGVAFGNLPWTNVPIQADIEKMVRCPVVVENDAKLACLSEAKLIPQYRKVLYITISTGIGAGLVVDGKIDPHIADGGGRTMQMEHKGKIMPWETFASGKAIVERFG
jgi:glucokinase